MSDKASFHDPRDFLASQLTRGRLALVLGAGVSVGFGLPNWPILLARLAVRLGIARPKDSGDEAFAEKLWRATGKDDDIFAEHVSAALYSDYRGSSDELASDRLLASIGALARPAKRGNVSHIVSFNFDDLIELHLEYFGISCLSTARMPAWDSSRADVTILHPHGLLPFSKTRDATKIVFTQQDYDRIIGQSSSIWHTKLLDIFSSNTCLFLGLSGKDGNLRSVVLETRDIHVAKRRGDAYWGVRISSDENDPARDEWEDRGVSQYTLGDYSELPTFLSEICRRAANAAGA
jgi:hypothetical protein